MSYNPAVLKHISERAYRLMARDNLVRLDADRPVFYAWPRGDRVILVVDPELVKNQRRMLSEEFRHDLSTILAGRRVRLTNSRGIFIQIAWEAPPIPRALRQEGLEVSQQPSPLHVPIGTTRNGALWLSLADMDAVLIGGSRRMGKTRLLHGWIQALIRGGRATLYLWDGKGGMEFTRYGGQAAVRLAKDLHVALAELLAEMGRRGEVLKAAGVSSLVEYNAQASEPLPALALVIDEVAHIPENCRGMVDDLVGRGGAYGVYPVLATTYPGHKEVQSLVRANLSTRISFPVPTQAESRVILGQVGAETLPKVKGRLLLVWEARLVEAQAFAVTLPAMEAAPGPQLTERERTLAERALKHGGVMSIAALREWDGEMSEWSARRLLEDWTGRGWLEKDRERKNARRVTHVLLGLLAQTPQTSQAPQTAQTSQTGGEG